MSVKAVQVRKKTPGEVKTAGTSFLGKLSAGELLTGTPTATISPNDGELVVDTLARNTVVLTLRKGSEPSQEDDVCAANQAVTWRVSGGRPGQLYEITIRCAGTVSDAHEVVCLLEISQ